MPKKTSDFDINYLINEHLSGRTITDIAQEFGVTHKVINSRIIAAGYAPRDYRKRNLPINEIGSLYASGMSELALSKKFNVDRGAIRRCLIKANIHIRTQSEAEKLRWTQMTEEERNYQVESAHEAVKGMKRSFEDLCHRAKGKQECLSHVSKLEKVFWQMLADRGIEFTPQLAIGPYNCDIASYPVAVEIWGGNFHFFGRHLARTPKKFRYLMDCGWYILAITTSGGIKITGETADYAAAYIKTASRDKTALREYRVIRGAGQILASGSSKDKNISIVPSFTRGRDSLGRYTATLD